LLSIKSRLRVEAAAQRAVAAVAVEAVPVLVEVEVVRARLLQQVLVVEVQAVPRLRLCLAQQLRRRPVRLQREVVAADRPVVAVAVVLEAVAVVAVAQLAVLRLVLQIARGLRFPAWKSSMPCWQLVPIPMWL